MKASENLLESLRTYVEEQRKAGRVGKTEALALNLIFDLEEAEQAEQMKEREKPRC
ncbi:hypothetical protein [Sediminibacillus massiliensis]|uniref:hypothetical protein n=1 Tax=Sediminibacillus massiliensis TaxID=1926277 RepID=UPI0015C380D5|nr:hypothetical protein [Sediminibacillus massiliensis]